MKHLTCIVISHHLIFAIDQLGTLGPLGEIHSQPMVDASCLSFTRSIVRSRCRRGFPISGHRELLVSAQGLERQAQSSGLKLSTIP